jgi:ABC-type uncharacterized transport system permease subunit
MDGNMEKHEELLKLPTDVPSDSKIALEKIFSSSINIITLIVISAVIIIGVLLNRTIRL